MFVLPYDVWVMVIYYLAVAEIKNIRLVNRVLRTLVTPGVFETIRIRPTFGSLERAIALCKEPSIYNLVECLELRNDMITPSQLYPNLVSYAIAEIKGTPSHVDSRLLISSLSPEEEDHARKSYVRYCKFIYSQLKNTNQVSGPKASHGSPLRRPDGEIVRYFSIVSDMERTTEAHEMLDGLCRSIRRWKNLRRVYRMTSPRRSDEAFEQYDQNCKDLYGIRLSHVDCGFTISQLLDVCAHRPLSLLHAGNMGQRDWATSSISTPHQWALKHVTTFSLSLSSLELITPFLDNEVWGQIHLSDDIIKLWLRGLLKAMPRLCNLVLDLDHHCYRSPEVCLAANAIFEHTWSTLKHLRLSNVECTQGVLCNFVSNNTSLKLLELENLTLLPNPEDPLDDDLSSVIRLIWALGQQHCKLNWFSLKGIAQSDMDNWNASVSMAYRGSILHRIRKHVCQGGPLPFLFRAKYRTTVEDKIMHYLLPDSLFSYESPEEVNNLANPETLKREAAIVSKDDLEQLLDVYDKLASSTRRRNWFDHLFTDLSWHSIEPADA